MNDLRRALARIPDEWSVHVLNGMFYEVYFNREGKFRGNDLKDSHLAQLFSLETHAKFAASIEFIRAVLEPYRNRLGVLPSTTPERLEVDVKLSLVDDPPLVESIMCRWRELAQESAECRD